MEKTPAQLYAACMSDVVFRFRSIEENYVYPALKSEGVNVTHLECAALQLRMVCELVAFGSILVRSDCANWSTLLKERDFTRSLKKASQINPSYFPTSIKFTGIREDGTRLIEDGDVQVEPQELAEIYGRSGDILHAGSLLRDREVNWSSRQDFLRTSVKRLKAFLRFHVAVVDEENHYLVDMLGDGGTGPKVLTMRGL